MARDEPLLSSLVCDWNSNSGLSWTFQLFTLMGLFR